MLSYLNIDNKDFEQIWQEVQQGLSIHESDWTNFNSADPGITMLQALTYLIKKQREDMNSRSRSVHPQILKLTGFQPRKMEPAVCVVSIDFDSSAEMPEGTRINTADGKLTFETEGTHYISRSKIDSVHKVSKKGDVRDLTHITWDQSAGSYVLPFGEKPERGDALYLLFNEPFSPEQTVNLYFRMYNRDPKRNPANGENTPDLGGIVWETWTENGFQPFKVEDGTDHMLHSGVISFSVESEMALLSEKGYCIRGMVTEENYDIPPRLSNVFMNAVFIRQKKTIVKQFRKAFDGSSAVRIGIPQAHQFSVMVLAADQMGRLRKYKDKVLKGNEGETRIYELILVDKGTIQIDFSACSPEYMPQIGEESVRIICYDRDYINQLNAPGILGHDDQRINIGVEGIVAGSTHFLIEEQDEDGEGYFVDENEENVAFTYELDESTGAMIVKESGFFNHNMLLTASCEISEGAAGKIKRGQLLQCRESDFRVTTNSKAIFGFDQETAEESLQRMTDVISGTVCAVTKQDYETLTMKTPGLCIHRAEAVLKGNRVHIIIKPASRQDYPALPAGYKEAIEAYLDQFRMITTELQVEGAVYAPIGVKISIRCKKKDGETENIIRTILMEELESIHSEQAFGTEIKKEALYARLETMEFVKRVESLTLESENGNSRIDRDGDVICNYNAVSCCGEVEIIYQ